MDANAISQVLSGLSNVHEDFQRSDLFLISLNKNTIQINSTNNDNGGEKK